MTKSPYDWASASVESDGECYLLGGTSTFVIVLAGKWSIRVMAAVIGLNACYTIIDDWASHEFEDCVAAES